MDFFDKLGKKATEAYKMTADKTGKIAKETKIKLKINDLKSQINDVYEEIGKRIYQNHIREHDENVEKEVEEMCVKVDVLSDEIESLLSQSLDLKDKRQCKVCFAEIEKGAKFCKNCGAKQEETESTENNQQKEENNEQESKKTESEEQKPESESTDENSEKVEETTEEKDNLERTVEIESNVESEIESDVESDN